MEDTELAGVYCAVDFGHRQL